MRAACRIIQKIINIPPLVLLELNLGISLYKQEKYVVIMTTMTTLPDVPLSSFQHPEVIVPYRN